MSMIPWESFPGLMSLRQAMDRLLEDSFIRPSRLVSLLGEAPTVPIDMYQTGDEVIVKVVLPGVKPEEVDITITGDTLNLKGESKVETEISRENYFYQERRYGAFNRSITLPSGLKTDKAEATFENGVLTLTIPKVEEARPREIKIKAKGIIEGKKA